ncbi:hypothetical protein B0I37DRAFT_417299 [Chaetomium sp. MPI-CAGE-AT-0009]|nr:hypothetical protein B0I37DRAFT_417299 [Chaetomium sp. MPI-CAGE-AT-0009]
MSTTPHESRPATLAIPLVPPGGPINDAVAEHFKKWAKGNDYWMDVYDLDELENRYARIGEAETRIATLAKRLDHVYPRPAQASQTRSGGAHRQQQDGGRHVSQWAFRALPSARDGWELNTRSQNARGVTKVSLSPSWGSGIPVDVVDAAEGFTPGFLAETYDETAIPPAVMPDCGRSQREDRDGHPTDMTLVKTHRRWEPLTGIGYEARPTAIQAMLSVYSFHGSRAPMSG